MAEVPTQYGIHPLDYGGGQMEGILDAGRWNSPMPNVLLGKFRPCGDWNQGIARIRCPDCGYDLFRPFSCACPTDNLSGQFPRCFASFFAMVGSYLPIIIKDVSTVRYRPQNLWDWAHIAMEVAQEQVPTRATM